MMPSIMYSSVVSSILKYYSSGEFEIRAMVMTTNLTIKHNANKLIVIIADAGSFP